MGIARAYSAQLVGLKSEIITIEVDISNGLNNFSVVGLADRSVSEAKDRISAAIKNTGYLSPKQKNQKVVISLAPADAKKEGSVFDLCMALAYLVAAEEIPALPEKTLFMGELSLEGYVRKINGLLPILCQAANHGFTQVFIPEENIHEACLARGLKIYPVNSLGDTLDVLADRKHCAPLVPYTDQEILDFAKKHNWMDIGVIRGNETDKRGMEIAAAGAHNLIMNVPPGTGKTMLAQSFCSILPPLSYEEALEVTGIHSAARVLEHGLIAEPPFRSPHHTASYPSVVGGGAFPRPGEVTLAHRGVLFMDEFPEFDRSVLEALRQPLEDRVITISRARGVITFPAQCILLASMNPCPCGKGKVRGCTCTEREIINYHRKISGPILDRIDLWVNVDKIDYDTLALPTVVSESSEDVRKRVAKAREVQKNRFKKHSIHKNYNGEMNAEDIERLVSMKSEARRLLAVSAKKFELSGRAFHRIIKVAQTVADLADSDTIETVHVLEALQYRDKKV